MMTKIKINNARMIYQFNINSKRNNKLIRTITNIGLSYIHQILTNNNNGLNPNKKMHIITLTQTQAHQISI